MLNKQLEILTVSILTLTPFECSSILTQYHSHLQSKHILPTTLMAKIRMPKKEVSFNFVEKTKASNIKCFGGRWCIYL